MEEMTQTRAEMMEIIGTDNLDEYIRKIEMIAWWYLFAITNNYEVSATRQDSPILKDSLELPFRIGGIKEDGE